MTAPSGQTAAHIIGAGIAGLSAAVSMVEAGWCGGGRRLFVHEAAAQAGGRCRSYYDDVLGLDIDNGNHLTLSGNRAVARYLSRIGAEDLLSGPDAATFAFLDLATGERWAVRPNDGWVPWWIFSRRRRVPGTRPGDYLALARILSAPAGRAVGEIIADEGELWRRFVRPVLLAALNTPPEEADAGLAAAVLRQSLVRGGAACRPRIAHHGLAAAFVDPALTYLRAGGAEITFNRRLRRLEITGDGRVTTLRFGGAQVVVSDADVIILAVPPWVASTLVPGLVAPDGFHAIVNGHFRTIAPAGTPAMLGLIGGTVEWIFAFPRHLSVTVSAADVLAEEDREAIGRRLWNDVARALGLTMELPPWQIVKEKRATFAATTAQQRRRPAPRGGLANLILAGDWTDTGLPATIEGAVRSGERAADLAMNIDR